MIALEMSNFFIDDVQINATGGAELTGDDEFSASKEPFEPGTGF